ncbi:hypothetical protein EJB05_08994, partial [Eragrostis curvula]
MLSVPEIHSAKVPFAECPVGAHSANLRRALLLFPPARLSLSLLSLTPPPSHLRPPPTPPRHRPLARPHPWPPPPAAPPSCLDYATAHRARSSVATPRPPPAPRPAPPPASARATPSLAARPASPSNPNSLPRLPDSPRCGVHLHLIYKFVRLDSRFKLRLKHSNARLILNY